jgi:glycerate kinase
MQGVEGHHGAGQVQGFQQLGEMAGLVVLDPDLEVIHQVAAVLGDAEKMNTAAVRAAGAAGGLAIHRDCP